MMNWEKRFWLGLLALTIVGLSMAQEKTAAPTLSTADKVALAALETRKQAAQKEFTDASQQELAILREWQSSHPGFIVNPTTFAIEQGAEKKK